VDTILTLKEEKEGTKEEVRRGEERLNKVVQQFEITDVSNQISNNFS
jgi:hypothetical protein